MDSTIFWIIVTALIFYAFRQNHKSPRSTSLPEEKLEWEWWDEFFGGEKPTQDDDDDC